jgi:hypothetical protein
LDRIGRALEAPHDKPESQDEKRRADENLAAQWQMVRWAKWMFVIGGAETVITLVGVILVLVTLIYSKQAAIAARDAVIEAQKATKVARDVGEAQVRAYISVKSANIYFGGDTGIPFVQITAINTGQSPARNFIWAAKIRYFSEFEEELVSGDIEGWLKQPGIDIHAGTEATPLYVDHTFALIEQRAKWTREQDKTGISVVVHFAWTDVFGFTLVDQASFQGVAEAGDAEENVEIVHDLNTSVWACKLIAIPKGEIWNGIAVSNPNSKDKKA